MNNSELCVDEVVNVNIEMLYHNFLSIRFLLVRTACPLFILQTAMPTPQMMQRLPRPMGFRLNEKLRIYFISSLTLQNLAEYSTTLTDCGVAEVRWIKKNTKNNYEFRSLNAWVMLLRQLENVSAILIYNNVLMRLVKS